MLNRNQSSDKITKLLVLLNFAALGASVYAMVSDPDNKDQPEIKLDIFTHAYQTIQMLGWLNKIPFSGEIAKSLNYCRSGQILFRSLTCSSILPAIANVTDLTLHSANIYEINHKP